MEDNRTFWELSFTETGLTEAQNRAAALEEGFKKIKEAADAAARNTGNNFVQLLQPLSKAEVRAHAIAAGFAKANSAVDTLLAGGGTALSAFAGIANTALGALKADAEAAYHAMYRLDDVATKAFSERSASLRTYTTILGDAQQAQLEYAKATELAMQTEFTQKTALKAQSGLMVAGFRGKELDRALLAVADVTSMAASPEERNAKAAHTGLVFREIQTEGTLNKRMLNMLGKDINTSFIREALGGGDAARGGARIHRGEVGAEEAMNAIYAAITKQLGTKRLGEFATAGSQGLGTLLSNRDEALEILLKQFDGETTPAVKRFKSALTDQTTALNVNSVSGKEFVMTLSDLTSITANVKTQVTEFATSFMTSFSESFNAVRAASGAFVADGDGLKGLGYALGNVGMYMGHAVNWFEKMQKSVNDMSGALVGFVALITDATAAILKILPQTYYAKAGTWLRENIIGAPVKGALEDYGKEANLMRWLNQRPSDAGLAYKTDADEAEAMEKLLKTAPTNKGGRSMKWGKSSHLGRGHVGGSGGYDITDLMGGGNAAPARTIQDNIGDAMRAAGQVSSAPSARGASGASGSDMHGQGSSSPTSVTIEAGAIVVSGVSDPMAAAEEAVRLLSQRIGRLTRAPGAGRSL